MEDYLVIFQIHPSQKFNAFTSIVRQRIQVQKFLFHVIGRNLQDEDEP